jgi:hypothetical protein
VVISGPWSDENANAVDQTDNFVIETRRVDTGIDFFCWVWYVVGLDASEF